MMEFKFCPHCGASRQGAFCGGCGFHFESFRPTTSTGDNGNTEDPTQTIDREQPTAEPEVSRPSFPVPFGMAYGESFDPSQDCWNCGSQSGSGECELCGFSKP